jgi:hypothetical protein
MVQPVAELSNVMSAARHDFAPVSAAPVLTSVTTHVDAAADAVDVSTRPLHVETATANGHVLPSTCAVAVV